MCCHLEGLDEGLVLVVPDVDVAVVEGGEHPWLGRVEVAAFHAVAAGRQTALDVQAERLKDGTSVKIEVMFLKGQFQGLVEVIP